MSGVPRIFGRYELLKRLGSGATGDVFLARPRGSMQGLPDVLVIKRLHAQLVHRAQFVKRFAHEAEIAASIESPHLARVYDSGEVDGTLYIALEYIQGWTLSRILRELHRAGRSAPVPAVIDIIGGALLGVAALHEARHPRDHSAMVVLHRDLAPKNLILGEDGLTRLIDLGLGKSGLQDWATRTGLVMGTPGYMAPEQAAGEPADTRTDLYAIGVVLWELLVGRRFIPKGPIPDMIRLQQKAEFRPPSSLREDLPDGLDAVCARALAPARQDRFESARAFLSAITAQAGQTEPGLALHTLIDELLWAELAKQKTQTMAFMKPPEKEENGDASDRTHSSPFTPETSVPLRSEGTPPPLNESADAEPPTAPPFSEPFSEPTNRTIITMVAAVSLATVALAAAVSIVILNLPSNPEPARYLAPPPEPPAPAVTVTPRPAPTVPSPSTEPPRAPARARPPVAREPARERPDARRIRPSRVVSPAEQADRHQKRLKERATNLLRRVRTQVNRFGADTSPGRIARRLNGLVALAVRSPELTLDQISSLEAQVDALEKSALTPRL